MLVMLITVYQKIFSPALRQLLGMQTICRFTPSCSEYAKIVIRQHGSVKGGYLALMRLLQCQPYGRISNSNLKFSIKSH